jgi:hypothetical protein
VFNVLSSATVARPAGDTRVRGWPMWSVLKGAKPILQVAVTRGAKPPIIVFIYKDK